MRRGQQACEESAAFLVAGDRIEVIQHQQPCTRVPVHHVMDSLYQISAPIFKDGVEGLEAPARVFNTLCKFRDV